METIQVRKYRDAYGDRLALKYRYNPETKMRRRGVFKITSLP